MLVCSGHYWSTALLLYFVKYVLGCVSPVISNSFIMRSILLVVLSARALAYEPSTTLSPSTTLRTTPQPQQTIQSTYTASMRGAAVDASTSRPSTTPLHTRSTGRYSYTSPTQVPHDIQAAQAQRAYEEHMVYMNTTAQPHANVVAVIRNHPDPVNCRQS